MPDPILLYSTASSLAYRIAKRYYGDIHYAWCSPIFDGRTTAHLALTVPPTSSPCEIYFSLQQEITRGDRHSAKLIDIRSGITRGAQAKLKEKVITKAEEQEIIEAVNLAAPNEFSPLLFVIPYAKVKRLIQTVPVAKRAHPLSLECLIPRLPGKSFDVLEFRGA